ncbi:carboxymuconolactone decarboxylase family protein [Enterobacter sichuanensis]|uniref:Carboxymuconolactone decarboxylase n=1 Tax=Enterobacter sichuanensis TaxID=2071710 RepID=A0A0F1B1U1_9ENTR|nr:carboxymuconolactone decarboxylase family protein [Enterobacter sichuanensis]KJN28112.1 carboxymuconolactone decarboxylase [Enterobacter sichuanensis]PAN76029.1 carboxymuconolactone decarboxylase [Enterobacter cloacae]HED6272352.1 carboxymuconolactone decarboxylase family protein [Enterobacter sichuanensis]HEM8744290.1 carboxymuconolactone decarboxylase family protein [Enterobacter sichuanensis]
MSQINDRTRYGREIMDRLEAGLADKVTRRLSELDPGLPALITDYAFGDVVGRPGLDLKTREMLTVASLVTLGNAMPQLELHMRGALNTGVTSEELLEIVIQMAVYAGVPACMNGLTAYREAMAATGHTLPGLKGEDA